MPIVVVDSREPTWIQNLGFGGCHVATSKIDFGDIQVIKDDGSMLIIERKTTGDLLNSIADGRLMSQAANIGQLILDLTGDANSRSVMGLLLISGKLYPHKGKCYTEQGETNWGWSSVQGALLKVQTLGLEVYHVENEFELEKAVIGFIENVFVGDYHLKPTRKFKELGTCVELLTCLPMIGLQKALTLSEATGDSFVLSLEYLTRPDLNVSGIGEKTKEAIRKSLGLGEGQQLIVITETVKESENE